MPDENLLLTKTVHMMKALTLALLICGIGASVSFAGASDVAPANGLLTRVDWQDPQSLPSQFRNHCTYESFTGRPYCSNHCGADYQFYYCSEGSFGCCHLGRGYCDLSGLLRCHL
jgi:hypothetical protein